MHRVTSIFLGLMLLISGFGHAQSVADAARANRKQKAPIGNTATKVITDDDVAAPTVTIRLAPGVTSTGDGMLVAPGRWKHGYTTSYLDCNTVSRRRRSPHRDHVRRRARRSLL